MIWTKWSLKVLPFVCVARLKAAPEGWGEVQNYTFSEYDHVAYQIKQEMSISSAY